MSGGYLTRSQPASPSLLMPRFSWPTTSATSRAQLVERHAPFGELETHRREAGVLAACRAAPIVGSTVHWRNRCDLSSLLHLGVIGQLASVT
jgi:hypothetical protein